MKATPSFAAATPPKQKAPKAGGPANSSHSESVGLSPDELNDRAITSTRVMTEILERDKSSYTFRHWGINE